MPCDHMLQVLVKHDQGPTRPPGHGQHPKSLDPVVVCVVPRPFGGQVDYGEILGFAHSLNGNNRYTRIRTPITGTGD